ncbi:acyl-CoA dehydrogenase family protein [Gordonia sp. i37]|uniref:acyl-CoA dehydrogenase family protein n=1 Tax=Gordonia sp. i37 TaxID=1961707 RepID=UPI0009AD1769|nr:acyl-CoA dehydrogenase family protein [Gordonia sp. i37]OPX05625.1 acyl-CoA dehydrogenase [Gordonia sp. i37]
MTAVETEASASEADVAELRSVVQQFVKTVMPRTTVAEWDKQNHFPRDAFDRLATLGVMGLTVPEEYGGSGRNIPATLMVIEELSKRSLAVAIPYIMASCYAGMTVTDCATEEQKSRWLPEIAEGRMMFAYGWTEPDVGADLASVKTTITREGNDLIINGSKRFCTGAGFSDYIYVLGRSDPDAPKYKNLSTVVVPTNSPGVEIVPIDTMGLKGTHTADVTFTDVRVPLDNLMGGLDSWNAGWQLITGVGLDIEKLEVAAMSLGIAAAAHADALEYSTEREQFGVPIERHQSIAHLLADMQVGLYASRLVLDDAARLADRHIRCGVETSMAKLFTTETCKRIVLDAQTVMGAYGYAKDFDCERYVRDILAMPIIGGSSAVQRNNIHKWSRPRK